MYFINMVSHLHQNLNSLIDREEIILPRLILQLRAVVREPAQQLDPTSALSGAHWRRETSGRALDAVTALSGSAVWSGGASSGAEGKPFLLFWGGDTQPRSQGCWWITSGIRSHDVCLTCYELNCVFGRFFLHWNEFSRLCFVPEDRGDRGDHRSCSPVR